MARIIARLVTLGILIVVNTPSIRSQTDAAEWAATMEREYSTLTRALDKAGEERDVDAVRKALACRSMPHLLRIKERAALLLADWNDVESVPDVIAALEENTLGFSGGSEVLAMQDHLDVALISALERLTGSRFRYEPPNQCRHFHDPSPARDEVIRTAKAWWADRASIRRLNE